MRILVGVCLAAVIAGGAVAGSAKSPETFHGVGILAQEGVTASNTGLSAKAQVKLGPFQSDAVILANWSTETFYTGGDLSYRAGFRVARDDETIVRNLEGRVPAVVTAAEGSLVSMRTSDKFRAFLPKGVSTVLTVETENQGDLDPAKTRSVSRLEATVIATPSPGG